MPAQNNQEIVKAAEEIESILAKPMVEGIDPAKICEIYKSIKKPLTVLLPIIRLIPVFGAAVAGGLELLMRIADQLCPAK
jgi:hypothetical protein